MTTRLTQVTRSVVLGWYLMVPPVALGPPERVAVEAPLSQWTREAGFETVYFCEQARDALIGLVATFPNHRPAYDAPTRSQCIASDDSRLRP